MASSLDSVILQHGFMQSILQILFQESEESITTIVGALSLVTYLENWKSNFFANVLMPFQNSMPFDIRELTREFFFCSKHSTCLTGFYHKQQHFLLSLLRHNVATEAVCWAGFKRSPTYFLNLLRLSSSLLVLYNPL